MNIHNLLVVPLIAAAIGMSGCATAAQTNTAQTTAGSAGTPVDWNCEPRMDVNWTTPPSEVVEARAKGWYVATIQSGELFISYFRDCGANVRGPVTERYPKGANLAAVSCNADRVISIFADPEVSDDGITQSMVDQTNDLVAKLKQSGACVSKVITPVK